MNPTNNQYPFPESVRDAASAALTPQPKVTSVRVRPKVNIVEPHQNTQPVPVPPVTPTQTATARSISLPSRFFYYPFKDLYVDTLKVDHLSNLAAAHEKGSMQIMAETISTVLSVPSGETNLAMKLSVSDFKAVLLWLRLNTFSKKRMIVSSSCRDPEHIRKVKEGLLDPKTLKIDTVVTPVDIDSVTVELENAPDPDVYSVVIDGNVVKLRPETVADAIAFSEHPDWENPAFQYKARIAASLDLDLHLNEKIKLLDHITPDDAALVYEFLSIVDEIGVKETVTTKCMECGASHQAQLVVDASCFLSPKF